MLKPWTPGEVLMVLSVTLGIVLGVLASAWLLVAQGIW